MFVKINKKISDKLEQCYTNEETKKFLSEILFFEFIHFEEARPRYMEKYNELINKYANKLEEK